MAKRTARKPKGPSLLRRVEDLELQVALGHMTNSITSSAVRLLLSRSNVPELPVDDKTRKDARALVRKGKAKR